MWRRIQALGLASVYGQDVQFSLKCRYLTALAFLPSSDIEDAFKEVKNVMPCEANELVQWFENNYVLGRLRRTLRNGNEVRSDPLFPPSFWSVFENIGMKLMLFLYLLYDNFIIQAQGVPRTQNSVESWHRTCRNSNLVDRERDYCSSDRP